MTRGTPKSRRVGLEYWPNLLSTRGPVARVMFNLRFRANVARRIVNGYR